MQREALEVPGKVTYRPSTSLEGDRNPIEAMLCESNIASLSRVSPHQVKEEPEEVLAVRWEAQWQEFLKTTESPHSSWASPQLPEKPTPWDNAEAFLASFEQVAVACQWPREEWASRLLPALSGEVEQAFFSLDARDREDFEKVKAAILQGYALCREKLRQRFWHFSYRETEGPRGTYGCLQELCRRWLKVERHSKEQILELLVLERFLTILPPEMQSWVRQCGPETCSQAVALAEDFLLRQLQAKTQEKQVSLEEASGSVSEAGQDPSETEQTELSVGIKEEEGGEANLLEARGWMTIDEGKKYVAEDSKPAESGGMSICKVEKNVSQSLEQENVPVLCGDIYKILFETTVETGVDVGKKCNGEACQISSGCMEIIEIHSNGSPVRKYPVD
ncbi:zinc finger and SCAN domain-containing protein 12-like [Eublepharis macularius]|uniref:Zinc finger and SCAN domain-containing protein 12-like n=1 Tax=Eublepharis macularius TaxID=481883 RepID=A0AA97KX60_EUBMA|nr:zinc finger and SCAN domain-containing protein 12-like [Eublepharis macularius]